MYILQCLRTLEISSSDMAGEESKAKREYRFYILRPGDGRYVFKCNSPQQRDEWTMSLNKVITVSTVESRDYAPPPVFLAQVPA